MAHVTLPAPNSSKALPSVSRNSVGNVDRHPALQRAPWGDGWSLGGEYSFFAVSESWLPPRPDGAGMVLARLFVVFGLLDAEQFVDVECTCQTSEFQL